MVDKELTVEKYADVVASHAVFFGPVSRPEVLARLGQRIGLFGRLRAAGKRLRALRSESLTPGAVPLDLSLAGAPVASVSCDEACLLRNGRIPERSMVALRSCMMLRSEQLQAAWIWACAIGPGIIVCFFLPLDGARKPDVYAWQLFVLSGPVLAFMATARWLRLYWDIRQQRLSVREGQLTRKWIDSERIYSDEEAGQPLSWPRLSRLYRAVQWMRRFVDRCMESGDTAFPERTVYKVKIGGRAYAVYSERLFAALGTGVRYRMSVSARAGLLVAIETVPEGAFSGYRVATITPRGDSGTK